MRTILQLVVAGTIFTSGVIPSGHIVGANTPRDARVVDTIVTTKADTSTKGDQKTLLDQKVGNTYWPPIVERKGSREVWRATFGMQVEGEEIPLQVTWDTIVLNEECHRVRDIRLERLGGSRTVTVDSVWTERRNACFRQPNGILSESVILNLTWKYEWMGTTVTGGGPLVVINSEGKLVKL